jgi:hypothetical protein
MVLVTWLDDQSQIWLTTFAQVTNLNYGNEAKFNWFAHISLEVNYEPVPNFSAFGSHWFYSYQQQDWFAGQWTADFAVSPQTRIQNLNTTETICPFIEPLPQCHLSANDFVRVQPPADGPPGLQWPPVWPDFWADQPD